MSKQSAKIFFLIFIGAITFLIRLLPHSPNFTPVGALFLFSGVYFKKGHAAVPLLVMFVSDFVIGFYDIKLMIVVYLSFMAMYLIGIFVKNKAGILSAAVGSLFGSLFFFITTNFAVWFFSSWYPKNLTGLMSSYLLAVPFFRNSLTGDLFFVLLFFGCYKFIFNPKFASKIINLIKKYRYDFQASY